MGPSRREVLLGAAATSLCALAPRKAAAATVEPEDRRFIIILALGGWDVTRFHAPESFEIPGVEVESNAGASQLGELTWVSHPDRPEVDALMARISHQAAIINGVQIPSVSHSVCNSLALTATTGSSSADWGTRLAVPQSDRWALPHVVLGGPSFAGAHGEVVARPGANGQLVGLADRSLLDQADVRPSFQTGAETNALVDEALARMVTAQSDTLATEAEVGLFSAWLGSLDRSVELEERASTLNLGRGDTAELLMRRALDVLRLDLCRAVTLSLPLKRSRGDWDSHSDNTNRQHARYIELATALGGLLDDLEATPDGAGQPLSDSTVVVVLSEMGRTPALNDVGGKDHWPVSSALVFGPGVAAGRTLGRYSENFTSTGLDRSSGELSDAADLLGIDTIGATILALGGVEAEDELATVEPLWAMLA